jgi:tetratricopeptide (TPR) repeat protein
MSDQRPDPLAEFAARLQELREEAGTPSPARLVELTRDSGWPLRRNTIYDKLQGKSVASWEFVTAFVTACAAHARSIGNPLPNDRVDPHAWDNAHTQMLDAVADGRTEARHAKAARTERARRSAVAGSKGQVNADDVVLATPARPVADWDPLHLGVHRTITVDLPVGCALPDLPPYAERRHDDQLRTILARPARNVVVVLVGGSSTGKTRAAWEAVRALLPEWSMVRPRNAQDLVEHCKPGVLAPNTVLWLNETQTYLDDDDGRLAAQALRLRIEDDGPVAVVGTMWPQYWQTFTTRPPAGRPDPHRQARDLLDIAQLIVVPEGFSDDPAELQRLRRLSERDPRLATAMRTAGDARKVVQVLAGGEQLVTRYTVAATTSSITWAVITAAMDARRLGHTGPIRPTLLRAAVPGYLTAHQRANQPDDWFDHALEQATTETRGIAALTAIRAAPDIGDADGYVLADYLDQHGRGARTDVRPPGALWEALVDHAATADDLYRVAHSAIARHLYRHGLKLATRAAEAGNELAASKVWSLLTQAGHDQQAQQWRQHAPVQDWAAVDEVHDQVDRIGRRAETGDTYAMVALAELLETHGRHEEAEGWLIAADLRGDENAIWQLTHLMERTGRDKDAERLWRYIAGGGTPDAMRSLGKLLARTGRHQEAEQWLHHAAEAGPTNYAARLAMRDLAELLQHAGHQDDAEQWLQRAADAGDLGAKCELLDQAGRSHEAEKVLRHAVEEGIWHAWTELVTRLRRSGSLAEAEQLEQFGIEPGGGTADPW